MLALQIDKGNYDIGFKKTVTQLNAFTIMSNFVTYSESNLVWSDILLFVWLFESFKKVYHIRKCDV